jgi:adenosine kinase
MACLVCGSLAFDTIMNFHGRFADQILADQLHILNVCFLTPEMRREYGGTAGNIAYNLKLLGEDPLVMATVGEDSGPYLERLRGLGLATELVKQIPGQFTAQAFITTDLDDNQITAFHPGAMNYAHENHVTRELGAKLAIIAPDGKEGMLQHARECAEQGMRVMFDPGQGLPMFSGEELSRFVELADYVAVNDYEGKLLEERTGRRLDELAGRLEAWMRDTGDPLLDGDVEPPPGAELNDPDGLSASEGPVAHAER